MSAMLYGDVTCHPVSHYAAQCMVLDYYPPWRIAVRKICSLNMKKYFQLRASFSPRVTSRTLSLVRALLKLNTTCTISSHFLIMVFPITPATSSTLCWKTLGTLTDADGAASDAAAMVFNVS